MEKKFIFVTGGVVSSLGKGLASASIGCLLESRGFTVNLLKFDPYLNVDPGTMSPYQHGEVYVTDDGAETDLDLGHYERYTHAELTPQKQPHDRPDLRNHHSEGTARRLSRQDRSGHSARHQRDQSRGSSRCRARRHNDRGNRRHRRRHRITAIPRSHPADAPGSRPREFLVHSPHACSVHSDGR